MMPPLAVWKIRPSGVVPYRLMWARSSLTSSGGMGMVRVSWAAVLQAALLPGGAVVGPGRRTNVVTDPVGHPVVALLRAGVTVTLATDDPGMFDTDLRREY